MKFNLWRVQFSIVNSTQNLILADQSAEFLLWKMLWNKRIDKNQWKIWVDWVAGDEGIKYERLTQKCEKLEDHWSWNNAISGSQAGFHFCIWLQSQTKKQQF